MIAALRLSFVEFVRMIIPDHSGKSKERREAAEILAAGAVALCSAGRIP